MKGERGKSFSAAAAAAATAAAVGSSYPPPQENNESLRGWDVCVRAIMLYAEQPAKSSEAHITNRNCFHCQKNRESVLHFALFAFLV